MIRNAKTSPSSVRRTSTVPLSLQTEKRRINSFGVLFPLLSKQTVPSMPASFEPHSAHTSTAPDATNAEVGLQRRDTDRVASNVGLPEAIVEPILVTYRSVGIGLFGVVMRFAGMPLEKIALFLNSSQVSGKSPFQKALKLTFQEGYLAPYRVVGPASITAWFFQYSVMGFAFQFCDHGLSKLLDVQPVYYGDEIMQPPVQEEVSTQYRLKSTIKTLVAPLLSATLESMVSNRAEVQRYYGPDKFKVVQQGLKLNPLAKGAGFGVAFAPNMMRNLIMCQTSFVLTPTTYKLYFPQEHKNNSSIFWYGLGMNMFVGNVVAITQQALWGRSLDYLAANGRLTYQEVIREGLQKEGFRAFFTPPKWFSRVLMNAPVQGVLPWFYNEVLPVAEIPVMNLFKEYIYEPLMKDR